MEAYELHSQNNFEVSGTTTTNASFNRRRGTGADDDDDDDDGSETGVLHGGNGGSSNSMSGGIVKTVSVRVTDEEVASKAGDDGDLGGTENGIVRFEHV